MRWFSAFVISFSLVACAAQPSATTGGTWPTTSSSLNGSPAQTITLLFGGDIMLGRRVAPVAEAEGPGLFEGTRYVVSAADLAAANLESPLTGRPHVVDNPNVLEADPMFAGLLGGAGFDIISLANNHAGDAGPESVTETILALQSADILTLGAGSDVAGANGPVLVEVRGIRVAFLAFDTTGVGLEATEASPGVARYDADRVGPLIERAARDSDLVVVSLHGGVEYLLTNDPVLSEIASEVVARGADVVWGHGPHVPQPVSVTNTPEAGHAVIATSLGNLLFDQQRPITQTGMLLEVLASADGVEAYRVGRTTHHDLRVRFTGWDSPEGQAVLLDGEWWSLLGTRSRVRGEPMVPYTFVLGDITTTALGDVTGDGLDELVVSYRRPFQANQVNTLFPEHTFIDEAGRSAHLGVFDPTTLRPTWVAGTLLRPVADIMVCEGNMALAFDSLEGQEVVATGAWTWWDFGFATAPELPGPGIPACADIDRDGRLDPVILGRT